MNISAVVDGERGMFCGWPANNGAWQWGDEFLFGYIRGKYGRADLHNVVGRLHKVQARSVDGGESWSVEIPGVDFEASNPGPAPEFDFSKSIIRVCGVYDHGGDDCPDCGGFYLSSNRGVDWAGPFRFDGLDCFNPPFINTSRTQVVSAPNGALIFLSAGLKNRWGCDGVVVASHNGKTFSEVGEVSESGGRVVMPSVAACGDRLVMCARRRGDNRRDGWIDAYYSLNHGMSWSKLGMVAETGGRNGNPPALINANGVLVCTFANRTKKQILYVKSHDGGASWSGPEVIRQADNGDIGYPQIFRRSDGRLVVVYYFSERSRPHQHIAATIFSP